MNGLLTIDNPMIWSLTYMIIICCIWTYPTHNKIKFLWWFLINKFRSYDPTLSIQERATSEQYQLRPHTPFVARAPSTDTCCIHQYRCRTSVYFVHCMNGLVKHLRRTEVRNTQSSCSITDHSKQSTKCKITCTHCCHMGIGQPRPGFQGPM